MVMPTLTGLVLVVMFFVPGYIISTFSEYFSGKRPEDSRTRELFRILVYGVLNMVVALCFAVAIDAMYACDPVHQYWHTVTGAADDKHPHIVGSVLHSPHYLLFVAGYVFAVPFLISGVFSAAYANSWASKVGQLIGLPEGRPTHATAWGYALDRVNKKARVLIELENGDQIYGRFGADSYQTGGGLYVEEVMDAGWEAREETRAIWIDRAGIKRLEVMTD